MIVRDRRLVELERGNRRLRACAERAGALVEGPKGLSGILSIDLSASSERSCCRWFVILPIGLAAVFYRLSGNWAATGLGLLVLGGVYVTIPLSVYRRHMSEGAWVSLFQADDLVARVTDKPGTGCPPARTTTSCAWHPEGRVR